LSPDVISEEKRLLRERILALRQSQSPDAVRKAGIEVARQVLGHPAAISARKVCLYASTGKELPTWDLMQQLLEEGKTVSVPDWEGWKQGAGIRLGVISGPGDLMTEARTVPQPKVVSESVIFPEEMDIFIIPGVAFDRMGNRLGMGGGYFDRLLTLAASKATLFGLAFGFQVLAHLPTEPHDIPVHHVVTPGSRQDLRDNK